MTATEVVRGACHHDCPDTCSWEVTVDNGVAVRLRGVDDHPTTAGELCPKVNRYLHRVYHPDRITTPLRRTGAKGEGRFEPCSWDDAIDDIAWRLTAIADDLGGEAIVQSAFDGTQGVIQKGILADRFFGAIGATPLRRHLCGTTAWLGAADVSGAPLGIDPEDLAHARTILLWGTNTRLTNRHLWPTLERARADGAELVVIDPVRTQTAVDADTFVQLRPGTDVALALAMIHVIEREGLFDREWLQARTTGWERLLDSARRLTPVDAERICDVGADDIVALARRFASNRPSAIRVLVGPEHRRHGRDIFRAISMLAAVVGAWRDIGGGVARSTQVYFDQALNHIDEPIAGRRTFNMAALGSILNDRGLDPPVAALMVHNVNPAVILPDQNAVLAGLAREDLYTVVLEQFMTDTARYADVVLPATTQLEHLDLVPAWGHLYLGLNRPAIEPVGDCLPNNEIFRRLAASIGLDDPLFAASDDELLDHLLDSDHPWMTGIDRVTLEARGWARLAVPPGHRPYVDDRPATADGRLQLGPLEYRPGDETPAGDRDRAARLPLVLLSRKQHLKFLNSHYSGQREHLPVGGEPWVEIHADDAAPRGLGDGDTAVVHNERGQLTLQVRVSADTRPGVVTIPFGWGNDHTPEARSVNALTNAGTDEGVGSAFFHETLVEVTALR